jgi:hypothetical protein
MTYGKSLRSEFPNQIPEQGTELYVEVGGAEKSSIYFGKKSFDIRLHRGNR